MDRGGVAELDVRGDVLGGQHRGEAGVAVPHGQVAGVDAGDGPAVAVLDPVGSTDAESAVVASGEYDVSDRGVRAVGQSHLIRGDRVGKAGGAGSLVELAHEVAGRCEHQAVPAGGLLLLPGAEDRVEAGLLFACVDAVVVEVVPECGAVAVS